MSIFSTLYGLLFSVWCFSIFVTYRYYFQVSFKFKVILSLGQWAENKYERLRCFVLEGESISIHVHKTRAWFFSTSKLAFFYMGLLPPGCKGVKCKQIILFAFIFIIFQLGGIDRLQLTSSPPCWMAINKRIIIGSIVPVIQHGRQGLCRLNLTGMGANYLYWTKYLNIQDLGHNFSLLVRTSQPGK